MGVGFGYPPISPDENEIKRQKELNSQVTDGIDLRSFDKITPDLPTGGVYDILEIMPYKSSVRIKLPQIITEQFSGSMMDIRINKLGITLLMIPAETGFEVRQMKRISQIFSAKLAAILASKGIALPARFKVTHDERIGGWVCRKEG